MKNGFKNMPKRQVKKYEKLKAPKETPVEETVPRDEKNLEWWRRRPEAS